MNRPAVINHVVYALVVNIILSSAAAAFNAWAGLISLWAIIINILISVLVILLGYKIYNGSNSGRYLYTIFVVITCFLFFGYVGREVPAARFWVKIIHLPINCYVLFCLFCPTSSAWFAAHNEKRAVVS